MQNIIRKLLRLNESEAMFEMPRPSDFVHAKISEQGDEFLYHIIKMLLWRDLSTDWYKTIWSTCSVAQKYTLVSSNKPPKSNQIKKWLVEDVLKQYKGLPHMIEMTIQENVYKDKRPYPMPEEYKYSVLLSNFNLFVDAICKELSEQELTYQKCCEYCNTYLVPRQI